jgi:3-oxoacyl-[acyl-carrier-protein] synthase II
MQQALADAGISPAQIDYLNAHGTGTMAGDATEAASLCSVFGANQVPVSSTKAVHGHLMGAGGALELALSVLALMHDQMPPNAHCREPDAELGIDLILGTARQKTLNYIMSNSFAFGGSNSVLVAKRWETS